MDPLKFTFALNLEDWSVDEFQRPNGPLFSRWIPDGARDCVSLLGENCSDELSVWFNRRGKVVREYIQYDREFEEVPTDTMERQGKLDAGPLFGEYITNHYTSGELDAVVSNDVNGDEYIQFGRRVVAAISEPVGNFIELLRSQYGQYWLHPLKPWDSREESLGSYCRKLYLHVYVDDRTDGIMFQPTDQASYVVAVFGGKKYSGFLSESNWREIQSVSRKAPRVDLAARILGLVSRLIDSGMLRQAFLEATTSLELALGKHFQAAFSAHDKKDKYRSQLSNVGLASKLIAIAPGLPGDISCKVGNAVDAIEIRNRITHDGYHPKETDEHVLRDLCDVVGYLLGHSVQKLPSLEIGNSLSAPKNH